MEPWPKLSEQLDETPHPEKCQRCGEGTSPDKELIRWREHDEKDKPTRTIVVLCRCCSDAMIEQHPRLYAQVDANAPLPGAMAICVACIHRDGTSCTHPGAKINGGEGLSLKVAKPTRMHLLRSPRRHSGWMTIWPSPPHSCSGQEEDSLVQA